MLPSSPNVPSLSLLCTGVFARFANVSIETQRSHELIVISPVRLCPLCSGLSLASAWVGVVHALCTFLFVLPCISIVEFSTCAAFVPVVCFPPSRQEWVGVGFRSTVLDSIQAWSCFEFYLSLETWFRTFAVDEMFSTLSNMVLTFFSHLYPLFLPSCFHVMKPFVSLYWECLYRCPQPLEDTLKRGSLVTAMRKYTSLCDWLCLGDVH